jgi:hypothetical protein
MLAANQEGQVLSVYKGPNKLGSKKDFLMHNTYPDKKVQKIGKSLL